MGPNLEHRESIKIRSLYFVGTFLISATNESWEHESASRFREQAASAIDGAFVALEEVSLGF